MISAISEFRIFACRYIYPENISKFMYNLDQNFELNQTPRMMIKSTNLLFKYNTSAELQNAIITEFIKFFNDPEIISLCRNKIFTTVTDEDKAKMLYNVLVEIQSGNVSIINYLFNTLFLNDNIIYICL